MCGIHAAISSSSSPPIQEYLESCLKSRGPDYVGSVHAQLPGSLALSLTSTVLSLRGDHVTKQPLVNEETGSVLCWNGEAWRIGGQPVLGNDTAAVSELLSEASRRVGVAGSSSDAVIEALRSVEGPFSFIYLDKPTGCLYYGRDRLGRRSLLVRTGDVFALSSVAEVTSGGTWSEVEADGCYTLQLSGSTELSTLTPSRHCWVDDAALVSGIGVFCSEIPEEAPRLCESSPSVSLLHHHLTEAMRTRALDIPLPPNVPGDGARLAILFSGGLDCTVLARLASDVVPAGHPIDLINVAFENPRIASQNCNRSQDELYELCPDRITGRKSFAELMTACPERIWRFVTVNVPYTETCAHRKNIIHLIHPHDTEMDLSIANALYFAARGQGSASTSIDPVPTSYKTTARVLMSGLGADELFGGYIRHMTAFTRGGYPSLIDELKLDVGRLGKRNLGRDDRVMSHWGREVRFPFLDERLVKWAIEVPVWEKCDFGNAASDEHLDPEKRVLRLVARNLGMPSVSREKKRAIQFGARTAKMESGKVKGTTSINR